MPRFIILDPSIKSIGGHYLEYANRVLDEAARCGYDTIIIANKDYLISQIESNHQIIPWFHRDFFKNNSTFLSTAKKILIRTNITINSIFSSFFSYILYNKLSLWFFLFIFKFDIMQNLVIDTYIMFLINRSSKLSKTIPTKMLNKDDKDIKKNNWMDFKLIILSILRFTVKYSIKFIKLIVLVILSLSGLIFCLFLFPLYIIFYFLFIYKHTFAADLIDLFNKNILNNSDFIFIPTVDIAEINGLIKLLSVHEKAKSISWRLLFRRDIIPSKRVIDTLPHERTKKFFLLRKILFHLKKISYDIDIKLYTDTDELTSDYNELGIFEFTTTTIPVDETLRTSIKPIKPLPILYIGDARTEKGFPKLPTLINNSLDFIKAGQLIFLCQSNFNITGGEAECVRTLNNLKAQQDITKVQLESGPLSTSIYNSHIKSAGIILIPYNRLDYLSRSSGIFAEAVAAGVPCLVPSGTTMARMAEQARQNYFSRVVNSSALRNITTKTVSLAELMDNNSEISLSIPQNVHESEFNSIIYAKVEWSGEFTTNLFLTIKLTTLLENNTLPKHFFQTIAVSHGIPGFALIKISGSLIYYSIECISPQIEAFKNVTFSISLESALHELPKSAGIGIFENSNDMIDCFRDLVTNYDHHRECMNKISMCLWPNFSAKELISQLTSSNPNCNFL